MTSPSRAIWWYEDSSKSAWMVGVGEEIGSSSGMLFNKVAGLPYVGNGNDWFYVARAGSVRTLIETTINNFWLDSNPNLLSNRAVVPQTGEIEVKCTGK